ncbi:asparaginase domain-containing protein [Autumnicola psychrophila]|uniref:asparaginase domain-containing protein n=1 Tax=Autumnicola psychrophila TaxID=3075592 RepID=UPI003D78525B
MEAVFQKDSRFITLKDRELLAERIQNSRDSKFLITHGSFTMEETSKYLADRNLIK